MGLQFNTMAEQIASQMQQLRHLAERNALLAEETRAFAALEERQRLARDLHDAVKQQLFGLSLTAGSIRLLMKRDPDQASERLTHKGKDNKSIATDLVISQKTVKTHVSNLLSKLELTDRTQAAVYALRQRIVPLDE